MTGAKTGRARIYSWVGKGESRVRAIKRYHIAQLISACHYSLVLLLGAHEWLSSKEWPC